MLSPFFGLSIFFHLCVIVIGRLLLFTPLKRYHPKPGLTKYHVVVDSFIMILILTIFLYSSVIVVYTSITGEYSTVKLISGIINK